MGFQKVTKIVKQNWDEIGIATALGKFYMDKQSFDQEQYGHVIEALRRSNKQLHDADIDELQDYLSSLDESQIPGLVSNIKGIAHEVYYVEAENEDGDQVSAYMFEDTNHKDYDVVLYDEEGISTSFQLKATDSSSYVNEAIDRVGEENVVVTSELAEKMGLKSSGISNAQLETDVETVVDKLVEDKTLWDYVPALSAWSISLIAASLTKRYIKKEISKKEYVAMLTVFCGAKVAKVSIIIALMSIPGVNVVTGAVLFMKLAFSLKNTYAN
ncbi:hypothetical protein [Litchfieldia alkalitelluris]|uniref:hypothetical protein n=1 Tax=Litchfieldia alkalitelluris TaxID=304268 RepID=UPI00099681B7|nr:hypothetical protein [Litchfieldia alkalitelluris]